MTQREPLHPINFTALADALLARIDQLVPLWLPGGETKNNEYFVHSVFRAEKTASLSVRMRGKKAGSWRDHGGEHKGGDLTSLYAAINGLDNGKAAVELAREHGLEAVAGVQPARAGDAPGPKRAPPVPLPAKPKADIEEWTSVYPVPAHAPAPTFQHFHRNNDKHQDKIDHMAEYRLGDDLYGYVVRFIDSKGKKDPLPYNWCISSRDQTCKWVWKQPEAPRALYIPKHRLPNPGETVVVVEGEKKADILQTLLDAGAPDVYLVVSWSGGSNSWSKANWAWLKGCTVLLWPDCDGKREKVTPAEKNACADEMALALLQASKPLLPAHKQVGMVAMCGIGAVLRDTHACTVQLLPIPEPLAVPDGWDCADAINTDGWDFARVLEFFAGAYTLPGSPGEPATASPAAKKNRRPR